MWTVLLNHWPDIVQELIFYEENMFSAIKKRSHIYYIYMLSLLLTAALGIQTVISYEFPEENRWNLRQKIKTTIVCSLCFVVPFSLNFHKFSSLRVKAECKLSKLMQPLC
jgi:hypothetical protein